MSNYSYNDNFKQSLINESLDYQLKFKNIEAEYKKLQYLYNTNIGNLKATIAAKEEEVASLKQKNFKITLEMGAYTSRNYILKNEKTQLEKDHNELFLKYEDVNTQLVELESKYQKHITSYNELFMKHTELEEKYKKKEEQHLKDAQFLINQYILYSNENKQLKENSELTKVKHQKDLQDFLKVVEIHNNENVILKQQLVQEKENFAALQKLLQDSYQMIYTLSVPK